MPKRERYVWVCTNRRPDGAPKGSCAASGGEELLKALKAQLVVAGLAEKVRAMGGGCQDLCWVGPTVAVTPDMTFFGRLTLEDVPALVAALGSAAPVGEHPALAQKVVSAQQFDDPALVRLGRKS